MIIVHLNEILFIRGFSNLILYKFQYQNNPRTNLELQKTFHFLRVILLLSSPQARETPIFQRKKKKEIHPNDKQRRGGLGSRAIYRCRVGFTAL